MHEIVCDLCQRYEDKPSFMKAWVRDSEPFFFDHCIAKKKNIEVHGSRTPMRGSFPAELFGFQTLQGFQKIRRGKIGLKPNNCVQEIILCLFSYRFCVVKA